MAEIITIRRLKPLPDTRPCREIAMRCWSLAIADRLLDQIYEGEYFVAEKDGLVVGFAGARKSYLVRNAWEIPWIAVDPDHHGQAIGTMLMTALLHELTYIRRASIILAVTQKTSFFQARGLKVIEAFEDGWCLMSKQVGPVGI